jgi:hypothetical protein
MNPREFVFAIAVATACIGSAPIGAAQTAARQLAAAKPNTVLNGLSSNAVKDLGPYTCSAVQGEAPGHCRLITDYSGVVFDKKRRQLVAFGGGHASTNYDALNTFSLDTLMWREMYKPTDCASIIKPGNYDFARGAWLSGASGPYPRAAARHTYDMMVHAEHTDELILLTGVEGNGPCAGLANYTGYNFASNGKIAHYNLTQNQWSFSDTAPEGNFPAAEYDPVSRKIVILGRDGFVIYDPATRTKTKAIQLVIRNANGSPVTADVGYANHLVYFPPNDKMYYFQRQTGRTFEITLDRMDFSKSRIVQLETSGSPSPHIEPGYVYDSINQIIGGGVSQNTFYAFNPLAKSWTAQRMQGGAPGNMAFHAIAYDDINNVYVFITEARQTWAYRYAK